MSLTLLVAAHPDDEVIALGVWMSRQKPGEVFVVHVTNGSPRDGITARSCGFPTPDDYAQARRRELYEALEYVGVPTSQCLELGVTDRETHLNLRFVTNELERLVRDLRPRRVITHAYEGGHPDHDSAALAVDAVRQRLASRGESFVHSEFPLYHADCQGQMVPCSFIRPSPALIVQPSDAERQLKNRMLECFRSQSEMIARFPQGPELLRSCPGYDFMSAPHSWPTLYECWNWGLSGEEWRGYASRFLSSERPRAARVYAQTASARAYWI